MLVSSVDSEQGPLTRTGQSPRIITTSGLNRTIAALLRLSSETTRAHYTRVGLINRILAITQERFVRFGSNFNPL